MDLSLQVQTLMDLVSLGNECSTSSRFQDVSQDSESAFAYVRKITDKCATHSGVAKLVLFFDC